jgi:hypothetical protein
MVSRLLKAYRDRRKAQQTMEEFEAEKNQINSMYFRLFSTDDGKAVLEHLIKTNLAVPIAVQGSTLLDIGVMQGRANVVNELIQRLEIGKSAPNTVTS